MWRSFFRGPRGRPSFHTFSSAGSGPSGIPRFPRFSITTVPQQRRAEIIRTLPLRSLINSSIGRPRHRPHFLLTPCGPFPRIFGHFTHFCVSLRGQLTDSHTLPQPNLKQLETNLKHFLYRNPRPVNRFQSRSFLNLKYSRNSKKQ